MPKAQKVINYYVLCNRLKDVIRSGWKYWHVEKDRIESVAEHIFGTQMLAIAINSEYEYNLDIMKVIYMLAIHELGEIIIGDLTPLDITPEEKEKIEHDAVHKILDGLLDSSFIEELFLEFDSHVTKEAKFAYQCDKLECDLQCKLYDEAGLVSLSNQEGNVEYEDPKIQTLFKKGYTWSKVWMENDLKVCGYDDIFKEILQFAIDNDISKKE